MKRALVKKHDVGNGTLSKACVCSCYCGLDFGVVSEHPQTDVDAEFSPRWWLDPPMYFERYRDSPQMIFMQNYWRWHSEAGLFYYPLWCGRMATLFATLRRDKENSKGGDALFPCIWSDWRKGRQPSRFLRKTTQRTSSHLSTRPSLHLTNLFRKPTIKMESRMSKITTLADAFYIELQDMYSAEQQLVKALPKMVKMANASELSAALSEHLEQTKSHVERVTSSFAETGKAAKAKKCEAMAGLIKEAEETMAEDADVDVADAILIGLAQKVEHYEIATYGTLCTWAGLLGYTSAKKLLGQNMDDEEKADKLLSKLSKQVNIAAKV